MTTAMVEGAITAGINGAIAGKNPLTAAIQGAAFAGLSCHLAEGPLSNLSALRQGAIISMTISGLSTLVNGGDPFKNMLAAGVASVLSEIAIPTKPGRNLTTRENAVRSTVTGITTAAMDGHGNLAGKVLNATVGACITTLGQNAGAQVSSIILNARSESAASQAMMRDMNTSIGVSEGQVKPKITSASTPSRSESTPVAASSGTTKRSANATPEASTEHTRIEDVLGLEDVQAMRLDDLVLTKPSSVFEKTLNFFINEAHAETLPNSAHATQFPKDKPINLSTKDYFAALPAGSRGTSPHRINVPNETLTKAELTPYTAPWFKRFAKALLRDNSPDTHRWQTSNQKLMAKEKVFIDAFTARQHERFSTPSLLPASHQNPRVEGALRTCRAVGRAMDNIGDGLLRLDRMAIDTGVLIWDASGAVTKVTFGTCTEGSQVRNDTRIKTVTHEFNRFMKADVAQKLDIITEVGATFALGGGFTRLSGTLVRNASLPKPSPVRRIEFPLAQLETVPERFPEVTLVEQSLNASLPKPSPVRGIETTLRPSKEKSLCEGMFILYRPKSKQAFLEAVPETFSEVVLVKQSLNVSTNTHKLEQPSSLMAWDRYKTSGAGERVKFEPLSNDWLDKAWLEKEFFSKSNLLGEYSYKKPGDLPNGLAVTFTGDSYATYQLTEDFIFYRAGTSASEFGQWFSFEKPVSVLQTRIDKALPPKWPDGKMSIIDTGYAIKIPKGTIVNVGDIAQQGGVFLGGTRQIVIEKPAYIPGIEVIERFSIFGVKNVNKR